jgi:hypothetical protein
MGYFTYCRSLGTFEAYNHPVEVLTTVTMKSTVFWDVMQCGLVEVQ